MIDHSAVDRVLVANRYLVFGTADGEVVATGESDPTVDGAGRGVEAVKRAAAEATVVKV